MAEDSYWFPAKRFGWGWGPPRVWQGWAVILLWSLALLAGVLRWRHPAARVGFVLAMSVLLTGICYLKGEPPRWRWGDP
jgi:CHASE2 domain-containing sensor protein